MTVLPPRVGEVSAGQGTALAGSGGGGHPNLPLEPSRQYLVLLAGRRRGFDQLLQDPQAHERDVLDDHGGLDVHSHEEEAESWGWEAGGVRTAKRPLCLPRGHPSAVPLPLPSAAGTAPRGLLSLLRKAPDETLPKLTTAQPELPAAVLLGDGVCQQQHFVLEAACLKGQPKRHELEEGLRGQSQGWLMSKL